jgi:hypothetical protein
MNVLLQGGPVCLLGFLTFFDWVDTPPRRHRLAQAKWLIELVDGEEAKIASPGRTMQTFRSRENS